MKKIFYISLAVIASAAVSCVKEDIIDTDAPVSEGTTLVLEAVAPADVTANPFGTKTVMTPAGDNYSVLWSEDDAISVNGVVSSAIEIDSENAKAATFTVSGVVAPCCAVYPAAVASEFADTYCVVTLPAVQTYKAGSFDPAAAVMLGYAAEEGVLNFSHAMAYLYLTVNTVDNYDNDNIKTVTVKSLGTEPMSGAFAASFGAEGCTMVPAEGTASTEVSLDCGEAGVAKGTPMVVALPAGTYAGMSITVTDVNGHVKTLQTSSELDMKAGYVYTTALRVAAPGIYNVAGYNAFAAAVNAEDYSAWVDPKDGEVNLYADLVSETNYPYISNFAGKFDGNGHTMTCNKKTRPLFNTIAKEAVVRNLTTAGTYTGFENQGEQAFASFARVNLGTIQDCVNDTDCSKIEKVSGAIVFGGFVGQNGGTIKQCTNNADITVKIAATDKLACFGGGFAAYGHTVIGFSSAASLNVNETCSAGKFIECVNTGDVSVTVTSGYIARATFGGVCGMVILDGVEFTNCENSGNISRKSNGEGNPGADAASTVGGICGRSAAWFSNNIEAIDAAAANLGGFNTKFSGCKNSGTITVAHRNDRNLQSDAINRDDYAGGIVGAAVGTKNGSCPTIVNCTLESKGKVYGGFNNNNTSHIVGGIAGLATNATLTGCNVYGEIGANSSNVVAAAGGVAGLTVGTVNISGGIVKPALTPRKSGSFSLSYGLLVGSAFNGCVLSADGVTCGGSIKVAGTDQQVNSENYSGFLCKNNHFTVTPTFTNCTWAN